MLLWFRTSGYFPKFQMVTVCWRSIYRNLWRFFLDSPLTTANWRTRSTTTPSVEGSNLFTKRIVFTGKHNVSKSSLFLTNAAYSAALSRSHCRAQLVLNYFQSTKLKAYPCHFLSFLKTLFRFLTVDNVWEPPRGLRNSRIDKWVSLVRFLLNLKNLKFQKFWIS